MKISTQKMMLFVLLTLLCIVVMPSVNAGGFFAKLIYQYRVAGPMPSGDADREANRLNDAREFWERVSIQPVGGRVYKSERDSGYFWWQKNNVNLYKWSGY